MSWLPYLIQVNLYLTAFYLFYVLVLRNETFFNWNRAYLVGSGALSFLIPLMQSEWVKSLFVTKEIETASQIILLDPLLLAEVQIQSSAQEGPTFNEWILIIYCVGLFLCFCRFIWQLLGVSRSFKAGTQAQSFFYKIKVSDSLPSRESIVKHEQVHASQLHSADVIFFELISIINWFNPVVYAYRKAIKHIHEFVADEIASTEQGKSEYALILVSNAFGIQKEQLANNFFNQSLLKKRIMMLNKPKSKKTWLLKYGLSAPLFAAMVIFSSATINTDDVATLGKIETDLLETSLSEMTDSKPETSQPAQIDGKHLLKNKAAVQGPKEIKPQVMGRGRDTAAVYSSSAVETMPEYPGGMAKFYEWVASNFKLPAEALKAGISGRMIVQFVVEKDGSLTDIKVPRDLGYGTAEAAKNLLITSPRWKPGIQKGKPVRVQYTMPLAIQSGDLRTGQSRQDSFKGGFPQVEITPRYPGGTKEFIKWVSKSYINPPQAIAAGVSGRLLVNFTVEPDGSLVNVKSVEDLGYGTGDEAVRVIKNSPKWMPGVKNGKPIAMSYSVPIYIQPAIKMDDTSTGILNGQINGQQASLIIVDGKEVSKIELRLLKPSDIKNIEVLKDQRATAIYGDKAKNGVIIIKTKE